MMLSSLLVGAGKRSRWLEVGGSMTVRTGRIGPFTVSATKEARPEVVCGLSSLASGNSFPSARRRRLPETRFACDGDRFAGEEA